LLNCRITPSRVHSAAEYPVSSHTAIAYTDEAIELFLAKRLEYQGGAKLDAGEFVETIALSFDEAIEMVRDGRITDAKSVAGLLWMKVFLAV
jgi:ADP-ribose pyrophosphatase